MVVILDYGICYHLLLTICGTIVALISMVGCSFVDRLEFLYLTYGITLGIGVNLIYVSGVLLVPQYFLKWSALALSFIVSGPILGTLGVAPILQFLLDTVGWRASFRIWAAVVFMCFLLASSFAPNRVERDSPECEPHNIPAEKSSTEVDCVITNGTLDKKHTNFEKKEDDISNVESSLTICKADDEDRNGVHARVEEATGNGVFNIWL